MIYTQILVNSVLLGGMYAAVAVGFSLVWGVMNILNILHGTFLMLGGYVSFWLFHFYGVDPFLSLPLSAIAMFCLGYLIQLCIVNQVIRAAFFMTLVLTFGLELIAVKLALFFWSGDFRSVQTAYAGYSFEIGGVVIPLMRLALFVLGLVLTGGLFWFMAARMESRDLESSSKQSSSNMGTGRAGPAYK